MSALTRKMPDPIMEPATSAVELNSPSVCTMAGAWRDAEVSFLTLVSSGVGIALVLSEFDSIVLPKFLTSTQRSHPPCKLPGWIACLEDGLRNRNHRRTRIENRPSCF